MKTETRHSGRHASIWGLCAAAAILTVIAAGCGNRTDKSASSGATGTSVAPAAVPAGTGTQRGNPDPGAAANAAAFKAARDKAGAR